MNDKMSIPNGPHCDHTTSSNPDESSIGTASSIGNSSMNSPSSLSNSSPTSTHSPSVGSGSSTAAIPAGSLRGDVGGNHMNHDHRGSTYRATIRTPMNTSAISSGMNASLTGLEEGEVSSPGTVQNLKGRARDMAGTAMETMHDVKDSLMNRASSLGDQVSEIAGSTKSIIMDKTSMMTNRVKNIDYQHYVEDGRVILREDPARTMMIAAGIGLAIGFLLGRSRE